MTMMTTTTMRSAFLLLSISISLALGAQPKPCDPPNDEDFKSLVVYAECAERLYRANPDSADALANVKAAYERVLASNPRFAPVYMKLGQLLIDSSSPDERERGLNLIGQSAKNDSRYLRDYAAALEMSGRKELALAAYEQAFKKFPTDIRLERAILRLSSGDAVLKRLWDDVNANELERAQSLAMEQLGRPHDTTTKRGLLSVIAATLAGQHLTPEDFDALPLACDLGRLAKDDPSLRPPLRELHRLYDGALAGQSFAWWHEDIIDPAPNQPSTASAFSMIARDLGGQRRRAGDNKEAEQYFKLACDVTRCQNPEAFLDLVAFYSRANRKGDVETLVNKYADELFSAKSRIMARGNPNEIYRYHAALGSIYSSVERYGDKNDPHSAIYQLDQAREIAAVAKRPVDPEVIDLLATSYKKVNPQTNEDLEVRLTAAKTYSDAKQTSLAQSVLQPVVNDDRVKQGTTKVRFDDLRATVPLNMEYRPKKKTVDETPNETPKNRFITDLVIEQPETRTVVDPRLAMRQQVSTPVIDSKTKEEISLLVKKYVVASPADQQSIAAKLKAMNVTKVSKPQFGQCQVTVRSAGTEETFNVATER